MVKHGLTRSEINLHFASKSHNRVIILSIGVEQAPGSSPCSLLGHFAWQDGAGGHPRCFGGMPSARGLLASETVSGRRLWERTQACGSSTCHHTPFCPDASQFNLAPGVTLVPGQPSGKRVPEHPPTPPVQQTQPSASQSPPVRSTGVELGHCQCVMLLLTLRKSRAASALAAATPALRLALMGEETGGNVTFWAARAAGGSEFLGSRCHGPIISRPGLFAGTGRQRGWVTPRFLPFLEAARSERDAGALITGCFHNEHGASAALSAVPLSFPPGLHCPASVSPLHSDGNTSPSAANPGHLQERARGCVSLQGAMRCVRSLRGTEQSRLPLKPPAVAGRVLPVPGSAMAGHVPARSPPCVAAGPCTPQLPVPQVREGRAGQVSPAQGETEAAMGML